jgi:hypothetical protein
MLVLRRVNGMAWPCRPAPPRHLLEDARDAMGCSRSSAVTRLCSLVQKLRHANARSDGDVYLSMRVRYRFYLCRFPSSTNKN